MTARDRILLTGGAGYIGTHTAVALIEAGHDVVIVDDLTNSSEEAVRRVRELCPGREVVFHRVDLRDTEGLRAIFAIDPVDAVIHFAGLKAVGESVDIPLDYYDNNLGGTFSLLRVMNEFAVKRLVFSSSATVYGMVDTVPITEEAPLESTSPYGRTKLFIEEILRDVAASDPAWHIILLRYFNPVGAHPSGRIGEDPQGIPNNLMPYIMQVAVGRRPELVVFGDDYDTPDGTCIRDFLHVLDLATGHVAALEHLGDTAGADAINLGTGRGVSVIEMIEAVSRVLGRPLPHRIGPRRTGDAPEVYADATKALARLGWKATHSLDDMCADSWRWQSANPEGFAG